ncbi:hypothetical protein N7519_006088 [Penicillium mononematosum]|uniref:uncharacterized protein n=1 Tax=Penicillium mononematosum TaxID=268346 RepID=UPI002547CFFC|nr:uncharacterized protein N7519_006088 [Penicillium mononematosum]KAJ6184787.1 hypothetical protein N7519_006088 [Penicillium mononematosum]
MRATSLSVIARKAAGTCGSSGWQRGGLVGIPDESNRPNRTSLSVNVRKTAGRVVASFLFPSRGGGTSLSVTARKAAERVVAQLDGDGGGWWVSSPQIIDQMSLSVNMRKAAGRVVARLFGEGTVINHILQRTKRAVQVTDDTSDTVNNWRPPKYKNSLAIARARAVV